jgi:hypothetical protein
MHLPAVDEYSLFERKLEFAYAKRYASLAVQCLLACRFLHYVASWKIFAYIIMGLSQRNTLLM